MQGELGPFGLDLVVGGVPALPRVRGDPVEIGAVTDEILGRRERGLRLRGEPLAAGRPEPDDDDLAAGRARGRARPRRVRLGCSRAPGSARAPPTCTGRWPGRRRASGEIRCAPVVARSTYQASSSRPAVASASRTPVNVRPSLRIAAESVRGEPRREDVRRQRPGQDGEDLVALDHRPPELGGGAGRSTSRPAPPRRGSGRRAACACACTSRRRTGRPRRGRRRRGPASRCAARRSAAAS